MWTTTHVAYDEKAGKLFSLTVHFPEHCVSDDGMVFLPCVDKHRRRTAAEVALVQIELPFTKNDRLVSQRIGRLCLFG